eukprot:912418-Pelagomonas_calceolata.AAC.2
MCFRGTGNPQGTLSQVAVREAAAKRLSAQPYECQKHVELLEGAKKELDRLVCGGGGERARKGDGI